MRKLRHIAIAVMTLLIATSAFAIDLSQWEYQAQVSIDDGTDEYSSLQIPPEIYQVSKESLSDLRLIDENDRQIPYVITRKKDLIEKQRFSLQIINRSKNQDNASLLTLDFGEKTDKNAIEVITEGNNFRRLVNVEGSNDNIDFFTIIDNAYVFAIDHKKENRFEQVDMSMNDYRYLRITVSPMADEDESPKIKTINAFKIGEELAMRETINARMTDKQVDEKKKTSLYYYDVGQKNLPISELQLDIETESFYRNVILYARTAETRKVKLDSEDNRDRYKEVEVHWSQISCDAIFRYTSSDGKEHKRMKLKSRHGSMAFRYFKVVVKDYDDEPLKIRSVTANMVPHKLIFPVAGNENIRLLTGAKEAASPKYDLARRLTNLKKLETKTANLGSVSTNPVFGLGNKKILPWTEKHKILIWIAMGLAVAVLGYFMLGSFKTIMQERDMN